MREPLPKESKWILAVTLIVFGLLAQVLIFGVSREFWRNGSMRVSLN